MLEFLQWVIGILWDYFIPSCRFNLSKDTFTQTRKHMFTELKSPTSKVYPPCGTIFVLFYPSLCLLFP